MRRLVVGDLVIDLEERFVLRGSERVAITERAFRLLEVLLAQPGKLLSKHELMQSVWGDACVEEANLTVAVSTLRKALRTGGDGPHIETVARRGYRWLAPVREPTEQPASGTEQRSARAAPGAPPASEVVVGRQRELERLASELDDAVAGRGRLLFISGEAGMGKTTLVRAFLERISADPREPMAASGHCLRVFGPSEAYFPLVDALSELLSGAHGDAVEAAMAEHAPSWRRVFPRLLRGSPVLPLADPCAQSRLRQLGDLLAAVSTIRPLVLCLEDIHWADPSTRDALELLATCVAKCRLLVLATFRPEAVGASSWGFGSGNPFEGERWSAWATERSVPLIELQALTVDDLRLYIEQRFPEWGSGPGIAALAHRRTEGLPLYATRWLATLVEGRVAGDAPEPGLSQAERDSLEHWVPERLLDVIRQTFERLAPAAHAVLRHASVEGDEFRIAVLIELMGVRPLALEEELAELARRRLIQRLGDEELPDGCLTARFRFQHVLYQSVLYASLGTQRRVELHRRAAEALLARGAADAPRFRPLLAMHLELGGDYSRAVHFSIASGEYADRAGLAREAMAYFVRARALLPRLPEGERLARGLILHHAEAWASACLGRVDDAFQHWAAMRAEAGKLAALAIESQRERATALAFEHFEQPWRDGTGWRSAPIMPNQPRSFGMTALEAESLACTCSLSAMLRDPDRLSVVARQLAELGRLTGNEPRRSEALVWLGIERLQRQELATAAELLDEGMRLARDLEHPRALGMALPSRALVHACRAELLRAERAYEECLTVLVSCGDVMNCFVGLGEVRARRGHIAAALDAYERAAELSRGHGAKPPLLRSGWIYHELGDVERAITIGNRAIESLATCFFPRHVATLFSQLARSHVKRGDRASARAALQQASARFEPHETDSIWHVEPFWSAQCELSLACGEWAQARDAASRWLELARAREAPESIARALSVLARVAAHQGDPSAGRACADAAAFALGSTETPLTGFAVHALRAALARRCQDDAGARQASRAAHACATSIASHITDAALLHRFQSDVARQLEAPLDGVWAPG